MTRLILIALGLILTGAAWAGSCRSDVGGTFKTTQPEIRPYGSIACYRCREVNHHPEDIRNFMWNWVVLGRGGTLTPGTNGLGRYIWGFRMNNRVVLDPIIGDEPGSNVFSVPVSNDHGQSATGTVDITHNLIGIRTISGFRLGWITGIREITVSVTLANGRQITETYSVQKMEADLKRARYKMPVPADKKADFAKEDDCLNNLGEKRPPDSQMKPVGVSESGDDPYSRWWDEEEAYGGRVPTHRCGRASISGGGSSLTCGWFWY